ncbi:MAG: hypothetical protein JOZ54_20760 [Acidobacteria bacterium]|nr:hypothetical protein [Acidobacteriota bacterium]
MRTSIPAAVGLLMLASLASAQSVSPDALLQRGKESLRAGRVPDAVTDLKAAGDAYLTPAVKQQYIATSQFASLAKLEESFIYLTIAYHRLGDEDDARVTIGRLWMAERIEPTYAKLMLDADAADIERIAAELTPHAMLPPNEQFARDAAQAEVPVQAALAPVAVAVPPPPAPTRTERVEIMRAIDARVAEANDAQDRRDLIASLREAESYAASEQTQRANEIYNRVANAAGAPREAIAAAATGLYRTSDFRSAARAFQRLGSFAKGEEDLRYYNAVSLWEIGAYDDAKRELACALPFIEVTDDVSRYRAKIERTVSQQALR